MSIKSILQMTVYRYRIIRVAILAAMLFGARSGLCTAVPTASILITADTSGFAASQECGTSFTTTNSAVLRSCDGTATIWCGVVNIKNVPNPFDGDCDNGEILGYDIGHTPPKYCKIRKIADIGVEQVFLVYDATNNEDITFYAKTIDSGPEDCRCHGSGANSAVGTLSIRVRQGCGACGGGDGGAALGNGAAANDNGLSFALGLGAATPLYDADALSIEANDASPYLSQPGILSCRVRIPEVEVLPWTDGSIRQVKAPQGLVHVKGINSYEYHLDCYYDSDVNHAAGKGPDGFYATNSGATPFVTWVVSNPDGAAACTNLWFTEQRGASSRIFKFSYSSSYRRWDLLKPDEHTTVSTWRVPDGTDAYVTNFVLQTSVDGTLVQKSQKTYLWRPTIFDNVVTQEVEGDGTLTQTTTYTYYSSDPTNGASTNQLKRVDYPDGKWVYYEYNADGYKSAEYSTYGNNSPPPTNRAPIPTTDNCKVIEYAYTLSSGADGVADGGSISPWIPRRTIVKVPIGGSMQEISRAYRILYSMSGDSFEETEQCVDPEAKWGASGNLHTKTIRSSDGRLLETDGADGTTSVYSYSSDNTTNTVDTGYVDPVYPGAIVDGSETTTVTDEFGNPLSRVTKAIQNSSVTDIVLSQEIFNYKDISGDYLDSLRRNHDVLGLVSGRITKYRYDCCVLDHVIDPDGATTFYEYDALKRQVGTRKQVAVVGGIEQYIETTNVLDGVGRVLASYEVGADGSVITNAQYSYDVLGRLARHTNPLGGGILYTSIVDSLSQTIKTNVYPDGGTRVETYARDGNLVMVRGTAVFPVRYEFGAASDGGTNRAYTKEIKLNADGSDSSDWTTNFVNGAGQGYKTVYSPRSGVDNPTSPPSRQSFYDTQGRIWKQVDPDGVVTLQVTSYAWDGRQDYAITALSSSAQFISYDDLKSGLDWGSFQNGPDRITMVQRTVLAGSGGSPNLTRVDTYIWDDSQTSGTQISRSENSTDGVDSWQTTYGDGGAELVTHQHTTFGSSGGSSITTTMPDNSYSISAYSYGRLTSIKRYDSGDSQISGLDYGYDPHGRQNVMTDARNGATTYTFNNAGQVASITTPVPGIGQSPQTTSTYYDTMLRTVRVAQPDGTFVTNKYAPTGLLTNTFGSRTYPVGYTYDAQGRMKTMTTWTNFGSLSGAATTTWNYNANRGWLDNKRYADSTGPDYTYTAGGRLRTRTWARIGTGASRIVTTNLYGFDDLTADNHHGDLVEVAYLNDPQSTPGLIQSYDRRGRLATVIRDGITTTLSYNNANQFLGEGYSGGIMDGLSVTNLYDPLLRRTNVSALGSSALSVAAYGYDAASRLHSAANENGDSATYTYLANSPLVDHITFKQGNTTRMTTTKQYDFLNRLTQISSTPSAGSPSSSTYTYNTANQRTRNMEADGSYWRYQYDLLGQVTAGKKYWPDQTPVAGQQFTYNFDNIGNRRFAQAGGDASGGNLRSANYAVNQLNQVTSRDVPGVVDIMGLVLATNSVTVNSGTPYRKGEYFRKEISVSNGSAPVWPAVTIASPNETSVTGNAYVPRTPEQFGYDLDGNLTNDGRWTYVWDAENRLVQMLPSGTVSVPDGAKRKLDFAYDYKGRRTQKVVSTWAGSVWSLVLSNRFLYDRWNLLVELNATNNAVVQTYLWGLDLSSSSQGAGGVSGMLAISDLANGRHFAAYDANGNVDGLVSAADGGISAQYEYGPFGEVIRATGLMANANPFRFSTKYQDDETDLSYYGYRYYASARGNWVSRDPITEAGGLNLYGFVGNEPLGRVDVLGLDNPVPPVTFSCPVCCCAESVSIGNITGKSLPGHFGNSFDATIKMVWIPNKTFGKCTLKWLEWATIPGPNMKPKTWFDQANVPTGSYLDTLSPWQTRSDNATEVVITDNPGLPVGGGFSGVQDLYIVITVISAPGCPCLKPRAEAMVHQHAEVKNGVGVGKPTLESIDSLPVPPGAPPS